MFLRGKREHQLSDSGTDALAFFRSGVFFISDDRTLVVPTKHEMHIAGSVQKVNPRFDQPFCGRSGDVACQQQEGFSVDFSMELGLSDQSIEYPSVEI